MRRYAEPGAYAALGLLLVAAVFGNDWGSFAYDTKPELYQAPWRTLVRELSAWRPSPHLGQGNYHPGFAPVVFVVGLIRSLGAEPWAAARILRVLLLGVGAWGMARHVDAVVPGRAGPVARVVAAYAYALNPYAIVSGATLPVLLPYAFLPWLLNALLASLRSPRSWRAPARFGLAFFASGGMNAGVVPLFSLLAVPAYVAYNRLAERRPLRVQLTPLLKCALLALGVSVYWLVPSLLAAGAGTDVAVNTERPEGVASTSSYAESLRLLGMWTMYGQLDGRLFTPAFTAYLTNPWAILATFAVPVAAALAALRAKAAARLLAVLLLAVALPVMVGLFPPAAPSPLGRVLAAAFEQVPGAIAFRTTNKAGALAVVAVSLLLALGAREISRVRPALAALAALVVLGATMPAWTGSLHPVRSDIPGYWQSAADDLNGGDPASRVLFVPGQALARYRWGHEGVDDLDASLLTRPTVWRPTVPAGSRAAANFLAALDVGLNEGALTQGVLPAFARYLGAGDVLLRNDTEWERVDGARPAVLAATVANDPELSELAAYGEPGQHTVAPPGFLYPEVPAEERIPPLQRLAVSDPRPVVRAEPAAGTLLVEGDNFALPALHEAGLLEGEPSFRLLGDVTPAEFGQALADGGRLVLTDSNRRREWDVQRVARSFSATLPADAELDPATSRTLFLDADDQTVTFTEGGRATATSSGSPFFPTPFGGPVSAFDHDPETAWLTGSFNTAVGQALTLTLDAPLEIRRLVLRPLDEPGVRIARVRIAVGDRTVERALADQRAVVLEVPPTVTDTVRIEIIEVRGAGANPVGFSEVEIAGVYLETVARLPRTSARLVAQLDDAGRAALQAAPVDVVLAREAGDPEDPRDDEERLLSRAFSLPVAREFRLDGRAEAGPGVPDEVVDRLAGATGAVVVNSSSREELAVRGSRVLDRDPATAWAPHPDDVQPWVEVRFPSQRLEFIEIEQAQGAGLATEVQLDFGDGAPVRAVLAGGRERITFAPRTTDVVRVQVLERGAFGAPVRIAELAVGDAVLPAAPPDRPLGCAPLLSVDGALVDVRPVGTLGDLESGTRLAFTTCDGAPLPLGAGEHRLRAADGWLVDHVRLSSEPAAPVPPAPRTTLVISSATALEVEAEAAEGPYYLVAGQAYDERWQATMDGRPLGPPVLVDGYSVGWRIDDPAPHRFAVTYGPQAVMVWTRWVSVAALAACLALTLVARRRGRRPGIAGPIRLPRAAWAAVPMLLWVLLGPVGLVGGALLAGWHLYRPPAPATLLRAAAGTLGAVPLAWLAQGLPSIGEVNVGIVTARLVPHHLAAAGLVLLVAGVARDVQARRAITSSSSEAASASDRSRARTPSVEGPPESPAAPNATAERPLATGRNSTRSMSAGNGSRPRLDTSSESEKRSANGASSHPSLPADGGSPDPDSAADTAGSTSAPGDTSTRR
jgi:arabinofuranan 3-O-arabinosyltransferase